MPGESRNGVSVEVVPASEADRQVLANLLELYIHDFSEFLNIEAGPDGRFGYPHLPLYWQEPGRHPFLIRANGNLAGFVLVKRGAAHEANQPVWDMAEFFVMRRYRRLGVGTLAANAVLRIFTGAWEIRVLEANRAAQPFWRRTVSAFAGRDVEPAAAEAGGHAWRIFTLKSGG